MFFLFFMIILVIICIPLTFVISYCFGSINSSILISKLIYKKDIRTMGSGNAGATNVTRSFGIKFGLIVLLLDVIKAVIPLLLVNLIFIGDESLFTLIAGLGCILGHCFPVFFRFKGGKGVSVAAVIAGFIDWKCLVVALGIFIIIVLITRYVSLSSILAATSLIVTSILFKGTIIFGYDIPLLILGVITGLFVIIMHRENIKRLIHKQESKITIKK